MLYHRAVYNEAEYGCIYGVINWGNSTFFTRLGARHNNVKDYSKDAEISHIEHMQLYLSNLSTAEQQGIFVLDKFDLEEVRKEYFPIDPPRGTLNPSH